MAKTTGLYKKHSVNRSSSSAVCRSNRIKRSASIDKSVVASAGRPTPAKCFARPVGHSSSMGHVAGVGVQDGERDWRTQPSSLDCFSDSNILASAGTSMHALQVVFFS